MKKGYFVLLTLGLIIAAISLYFGLNSTWQKPVATKNQPCLNCNILLIDVDILRADALPCYGYFRNTTPNICQLAQKSVLFQDNYAPSNWTLPSAFSTATSIYPAFHRIELMFVDKLSLAIPTLAETLQTAGHQTALVGSSSLPIYLTTENGGARGFDLVTEQPIAEVIEQLSKSKKPWFIQYYLSNLHLPYLLEADEVPIAKLEKPKNLLATHAEFNLKFNSYLKRHATEVFQKKALQEFGSIIFAPETENDLSLVKLLTDLFENGGNSGEYLINAWKPKYETYMESFDQNNPSEVAYVRMLYDTKLRISDYDLGVIFDLVANSDLAKKTITVIMSDHGESFGERGKFNHEPDHHTELFFTPLIINSPNISASQIKFTTTNLDIFPTLVDLVGLVPPKGLQGISLLAPISNGLKPTREFVFSQSNAGEIILQNRDWLYYLPVAVQTASQSGLYNKILDPQEKLNVAEKYPELTQSLFDQARLLRSYDEMLAAEVKNPDYLKGLKLSPEKIERMKTEGYF